MLGISTILLIIINKTFKLILKVIEREREKNLNERSMKEWLTFMFTFLIFNISVTKLIKGILIFYKRISNFVQ